MQHTLWLYLGSLSLIGLGLLFFAVRDYGRNAADQSYDKLLMSSALSIIGSTALIDRKWEVDLPYTALELLAMSPSDRVFYRVFDRSGSNITGYADLPAPPSMPTEDSPLLFDAMYSGEAVRFAVVARRFTSMSGQDEVLVQVGQTRIERERLANDIVMRALAVIATLSMLSIIMVGLGVHHSLRPLSVIEHDLSVREPSDLQPLAVSVPREMEQMVSALNHFMKRLADGNEMLRAFMAEAAHQMRTPLAAMHAQAQLALEEEDVGEMHRSLTIIERNAGQMGRLLNQLLSDASVIHRSHLQMFEWTDLREVLLQALQDGFPLHVERPGIELHVPGDALPLRGDALLLGEAIKNLLDNARKYAPGSPLEIALERKDGDYVLTVADRGPGIPPAEFERVMERFVRGSSAAVGGTGLGLAIVKRIVENHGGRVCLAGREGGGLKVELRIPEPAT